MSTTITETLAKIEGLLGAVAGGGTQMVEMTPTEFVAHAQGEIAKAATEAPAVSTRRLKALHTAVQVFKDNYVDGESDAVKVPITWTDTTALDEKQNQLIDPTKGVPAQNQSAFSQGFVAKIESLSKLVSDLKKAGTLPEDGTETEGMSDEDKAKAKKAEDEENEKAAKVLEAAGLTKAAARFAKAKKTDGDEGSSAGGATAAEPPKSTPEVDDEEKRKNAAKGSSVAKAVDVSADGTAWPADLADPAFVKDGTVNKALDWGNDRA